MSCQFVSLLQIVIGKNDQVLTTQYVTCSVPTWYAILASIMVFYWIDILLSRTLFITAGMRINGVVSNRKEAH